MITPTNKNIIARPAYIGALSGDFIPSADSSSVHTLGRLLRGAILNGVPEEVSDGGIEYSYHPRWAPGTLAVASCIHDAKIGLVLATQLSLYSDSEKLRLTDGVHMAPARDAVGINEHWISLRTGVDEARAREVVTSAARVFFG